MSARDPDSIAGWGRLAVPGRELRSEDLRRITLDVPLSRGLGRSYGDASLPPRSRPVVANTTLADRVLAFDPASGVVRAEAGLSLASLHRLFLARGFFSPITPGTQQITLGGAVAADIHGKNHHVAGCFGAHVQRLLLRVADGRVVSCGPDEERDLFRATLGGMGLTGHILEVEFRMERVPSSWFFRETERMPNIDAFLDGLAAAAREWPHTMGWIDCLSRGAKLGRGILMRGRWAAAAEAPSAPPGPRLQPFVPFELPGLVLSRFSVSAFNEVYYSIHIPAVKRGLSAPEPFLFPLDSISHWNRLYGKRGFTQYQCVIPRAGGPRAVRALLEALSQRGGASFLCVIKDCGPEGIGLLSFPKPGISIALDIPIRAGTQALVDDLNTLVIAEGGRVYLAKDTFTRAEHFRQMEPRLPEWQAIRRKWDPDLRLRSAQSVRILGDPP